jgi:hypothetical protein
VLAPEQLPEPFYRGTPPAGAPSPESYKRSSHSQHLRGPSTPSRIKPRDSAQDDSVGTGGVYMRELCCCRACSCRALDAVSWSQDPELGNSM